MKRLLFMTGMACILFVSACKNNNEGGMTPVNIRLTDGPGAYDALILNVKSVNVTTSEGQSSLPVNGIIDVLKFRMGKDTLIASQDIPSGTIHQVRLVLNETGNLVRINGVDYPLTTPSGQSSGVKLNVQQTLETGVAYTLLLDFDAAKSIVQTGNGKYILKPVIRAIPAAVSGAITGIVSPAAASPKVYAIAGTDTIGTIADATGKYYFPGMTAGTYRVNFEPVSPYKPVTVDNVVVTTGSVTNMGTVNITQ